MLLWTGLVSGKMDRSRWADSRTFLKITGLVTQPEWKTKDRKKSKMLSGKTEKIGLGAIY